MKNFLLNQGWSATRETVPLAMVLLTYTQEMHWAENWGEKPCDSRAKGSILNRLKKPVISTGTLMQMNISWTFVNKLFCNQENIDLILWMTLLFFSDFSQFWTVLLSLLFLWIIPLASSLCSSSGVRKRDEATQQFNKTPPWSRQAPTNPYSSSRNLISRGQIMPPAEIPVATMARAMPRLFEKWVGNSRKGATSMTALDKAAGVKM